MKIGTMSDVIALILISMGFLFWAGILLWFK